MGANRRGREREEEKTGERVWVRESTCACKRASEREREREKERESVRARMSERVTVSG